MATLMHAHRCIACAKKGKQTVWIHSDDCLGVVSAHKCPECGEVEWKKWLVEPGRLPQAHNQQGAIDLNALLGYILLAIGLALIGYGVFLYVKKMQDGKAAIPDIP